MGTSWRKELVVTEKYELDHRDKLKLRLFWPLSDYLHFDARNQIDSFWNEWFATNGELTIETLIEEIKASVTKMGSKLQIKQNYQHLMDFPDYQDSYERNKFDNFPMTQFTTSKKLLIETYIKNLNHVIFEKTEFRQIRKSNSPFDHLKPLMRVL